MGSLEQFVKSAITRIFAVDYPHLKLPAVVYATVTETKELSNNWYEYTLRVIDRFGNTDDTFPELPGIRSKIQLDFGAIAAIGLAYGDVEPVIIGEVIL